MSNVIYYRQCSLSHTVDKDNDIQVQTTTYLPTLFKGKKIEVGVELELKGDDRLWKVTSMSSHLVTKEHIEKIQEAQKERASTVR